MNDPARSVEQLIHDYLAAWNASDSNQRSLRLDRVLAADCIYADSHLPKLVKSKEQHGQFIEQFKSKFPELKILMSSTPDAHHNFFRFNWQIAKPTGDVFTQGAFFGEINEEGKIS